MPVYTTDKDIYSLVRAFEERTLSKSEWTHAAHLTVGLYYCFHHPLGVAKNLMRDGIYWLNDSHGTPNTDSSGYHETLTFFWLKTISNFLEEHKDEKSLMVLVNKLVTTYTNSRLPLEFYTHQRIKLMIE